jgi:CheY-like chemotaxis protein
LKQVRVLIVEDNAELLASLQSLYGRVFGAHGYTCNFTTSSEVTAARRLAKAATQQPYDFVSLDVNLGDAALTGLDVLATLHRFHSAWMVALLTGIESDETLDATMGSERGERLRKRLRHEAYASFPAERLMVVEKPSPAVPPEEAEQLLVNRIQQIALVYAEVERLRYIFRPITVIGLERVPARKGQRSKRAFVESSALHWQIRFNCGEIRTLADMAGFRTLHYLLTRGRQHAITPEEALAYEPKVERGADLSGLSEETDPLATFFEAQGICWRELEASEQQDLIRAALSLQLKRYVELRQYQDEGDISAGEDDQLATIIEQLGPLATAAENVYQSLRGESDEPTAAPAAMSTEDASQHGLHLGSGNYVRAGPERRGMDSPAAQLFRARMKRVKDYLRENGFADFAKHVDAYVQSTGASWSYAPGDDLEWTT